MKKWIAWFLLLNKRLYKKATFVCLLLLIPLLVSVFHISAQQPSGVVTVILARQDPNDSLCAEIVAQLQSDTKVIAFREETPQMAVELVTAGKADAAWIFPADVKAHIRAFASGEQEGQGFIQVLEREQTVVLRLAREKLNGVLFERSVQQVYLRYVRECAPESADLSDQELLAYLEKTNVTGQLFEYYDIYGNQKTESANYLTAPLRGLLAVIAAIGSAVTAMYYQKDKEKGIFSLLPERYQPIGEFGYQMISACNIMAVVLCSLLISGLSVNLGLELMLFLLYSICCALFGMMLRTLLGGGKWLAAWLPVLAVLMLAICPVFFDVSSMQKLQLLLPPTYYITGAYNYRYLLYMLCYIGALLVIYAAGYLGKNLMRRRKAK